MLIKKTAPLVAALAAGGVAVAVAQASTSHAASTVHVSINQSGRLGSISSKPLPPPPPPTGTPLPQAGNLTGKPGNGAIVANVASMGVGDYSGTATLFEPQGSFTGTITTNKGFNGHARVVLKITKGTGLYTGATGTVTLTWAYGSVPGQPLTVSGSITY